MGGFAALTPFLSAIAPIAGALISKPSAPSVAPLPPAPVAAPVPVAPNAAEAPKEQTQDASATLDFEAAKARDLKRRAASQQQGNTLLSGTTSSGNTKTLLGQ